MKEKTLLLVLVFFLVASASAQEAESFEILESGEDREIFAPGENLEFRLDATDAQDYNLTVSDRDGGFRLQNEPMNQTEGSPEYIYQYENFSSGNSTGYFDLSVNYTGEGTENLLRTEYLVVGDTPVVTRLDSQERVETGDRASVTVYVADSNPDLSAEISYNGESFEMNQIESGKHYSVFRGNFEVQETGENDFTVFAEDENGQIVDSTGTVIGYDNEEDVTTIGVSVDYSCTTAFNEFGMPGDGVLPYEEYNFFNWDVENVGAIDANVSAELNVTYEGNNPWSPGEKVGPTNFTPQLSGNETNQTYTVQGENFTLDEVYSQRFEVGPVLLPNATFYVNGTREILNRTYNNSFVYSETSLVQAILAPKQMYSGWYSARTNLTTRCYDVYSDEDTGELRKNTSDVIEYETFAYSNFKIVNSSGGVSETGNESTNSTVPSDSSELDDEQTNTTLEGNESEPGETEVPEPEPVPTLSLDVEPRPFQYETRRGQGVQVNFEVTNLGNTSLPDVTLSPQLGELPGSWRSSNVSIANLTVGETVNRTVLLTPGEEVEPGSYSIPVLASYPERSLDIDYFRVDVTSEPVFTSNLEIVEAPRDLTLETNASQPIPVLVSNPGNSSLRNVTAEIQNVEDCATYEAGVIEELEPNETSSLSINLSTVSSSESCSTTLLVSSEEGAYSFTDLNIEVTPPEGLIPEEYQVPLVAFAWTGLLAGFAVLRRRYDLKDGIFKAPFVLLVMGETLIFVYLVVDYYGLVTASFLPF